jgi:hypothetical protein
MVAHLSVNPDIPQRSKPLLADEHTGTSWYSIPGEVREHRAKLKNISNAQMVQIEKFAKTATNDGLIQKQKEKVNELFKSTILLFLKTSRWNFIFFLLGIIIGIVKKR